MLSPQKDTIVDERYAIIDQIGEGGMGTVFKAIEKELNRKVALKLLHSGLIADEEHRARFEREGKILSGLHHRNILTFYRFGVWKQTRPYIVMEFLEGPSLRQLMDNGGLTPERAIQIAIQICDGMQAAHQMKVVHRDLKPSNIIIVDDDGADVAKILDFGLARILTDGKQSLTQTGDLVGSVQYMSPEQCKGQRADERSDIYSLGCIIYEMICGEAPYLAENPIALIHKHTTELVSPLTSRMPAEEPTKRNHQALIKDVDAICSKALSKLPEERYQSMAEMAHDLRLAAAGQGESLPQPKVTERPAIATGAHYVAPILVVGLVSLLILVVYFSRHSTPGDNTSVASIRHKQRNSLAQARSAHAKLGLLKEMSSSPERWKLCDTTILNDKTTPIEDISDFREIVYIVSDQRRLSSVPERQELVRVLNKALVIAEQRFSDSSITAEIISSLAIAYSTDGDAERTSAMTLRGLAYLNRQKELTETLRIIKLRLLALNAQANRRLHLPVDEKRLIQALNENKHLRAGPAFVSVAIELAYLKFQHGQDVLPLWKECVDRVRTKEVDSNGFVESWWSIFQQSGHPTRLLPLLENWDNECPSFLQGHELLVEQFHTALIYSSLDKKQTALAIMTKAEQRVSNNCKDENFLHCLHLARGGLLIDQDKPEEALIEWKKGLTHKCDGGTFLCDFMIRAANKNLLSSHPELLDEFDAICLKSKDIRTLSTAYNTMAESLPADIKNKEALNLLLRGEELTKQLGPNTAFLKDTRLRIAKQLLLLGRYSEAKTILDKVTPFLQGHSSLSQAATLVLIKTEMKLHQEAKADELATELLKRTSAENLETCLDELAFIYECCGRMEAAEAYFTRAVKLRAPSQKLDATMANFYLRNDLYHQAANSAQASLTELPKRSSWTMPQIKAYQKLNLLMGLACQKLNKMPAAQDYLRKAADEEAIDDFMDVVFARIAYARALMPPYATLTKERERTVAAALSQAQQGINCFTYPSNKQFLALARASLLAETGKKKEAISRLNEAVTSTRYQTDQVTPDFLRFSAEFYQRQSLPQKALQCLDLSLQRQSLFYSPDDRRMVLTRQQVRPLQEELANN